MSCKKPGEVIHCIENFTLKPQHFSHKTHLELAWELLHLFEPDKAEQKACDLLKSYTYYFGVAEKYHHTLTIAGIKTIRHFLLKSKQKGFEQFLEEFPVLEKNFSRLIEQHYSDERIRQLSARTEYLKPDLLPYDE